MKNTMGNDIKISICGDVCSECPRFIATKDNDLLQLEKIAELWYRLGFRDQILNPEDLKCSGCSKDKVCSYNINQCEHLDKIENCGECHHFPCKKISAVFEKTEASHKACMDKCSEIEFKILTSAFFGKRQILTEINQKTHGHHSYPQVNSE